MKTRKDPRRRTLRLAIGGMLLASLATGCSAEPTPPVNYSASADVLGPSAAPTPTKASVEPSSAPPTVTSPPSATPSPSAAPEPSEAPTARPTASIGTALVGGYVATWCAPTKTQCQNWGGNVAYAAVHSFHSGDKPYWVTVTYHGIPVRALVVSYCSCGLRHGHPVIDLSPAAMKQLEPDYRRLGVLRYVEIEGLR